MFKNLVRKWFMEFVSEGLITTQDVKLVKNDNLANQREYNIDNNNEVKGFQVACGMFLFKFAALEKFLGIEFDEGLPETICEGCGEVTEEGTEPSYSKVKRGKK